MTKGGKLFLCLLFILAPPDLYPEEGAEPPAEAAAPETETSNAETPERDLWEELVEVAGAIESSEPSLSDADLHMAVPNRNILIFPFWGENQDIVDDFIQALYLDLGRMGLSVEHLTLDRLLPGIPPRGLPPHLSPRPMSTDRSSLGITGNIFLNPANGHWHLQLYLWDLKEDRLLFSDELAVANRNNIRSIMPFMVRWLISQVPREGPPQKFLYMGLRLGGDLQLFVPVWGNGAPGLSFSNVDGAFLLNFQFFNSGFLNSRRQGLGTTGPRSISFLGLQLEGLVMWDSEQGALSMMFPAMVRFTVRRETSFFSVMVGGFYLYPLDPGGTTGGLAFGHSAEDFLWGYTAGLALGWKVGAGYLSTGLRWYGDMFSSISLADGNFYNRQTVGFYLSYELGLFNIR